ncbi:MAG: NAD(FAD)-utilizing dehydrogenases [uncultured Thiotrichaceae bacterium]|uniref:NAD(FAD)-utilizing dehydrogenases n=1 Tax=uncultured Thiotrichaceae bacterium TaxID=298394 RepID=A0A6S6THP2_9GAMM|nr:MAG: NAD(FAD)-utilizing dehydrogenases [uncultured Thiotrichaceae bacterium]
MCAIEAAKRQRSVIVLDKAPKAGRKILISGGGRCNFTNLYTEPEAYLSQNQHFCKSALARYTQWDFMNFMEEAGLSWEEKTLGQLFCDQKSKAVVDALLKACEQYGVEIILNSTIANISHTNQYQIKHTNSEVQVESLVIATGGPSIPKMGSSDFGLQIAKQFGLKNMPFRAGLVPFTFSQDELTKLYIPLAGVATDCVVTCNGQSFKEALLFTHRGLSGPAMLQISSYWKKGDGLLIDLLPELETAKPLLGIKENSPALSLKKALQQYLPRKLIVQFIELGYLPDLALKSLHEKQLTRIVSQLKSWKVTPSGTEGMRTAEVALGGVDTGELSSKTFETKKQEGLYFIGETVDVTGHLGGYNFQWAWASGWCAGQFV